MSEGPCVNLNLEIYEARLMRAVDGHVADLKAVLRSLDDGSFLARATTPSPGAVVGFTIGQASEPQRDAAQRACANCFKAIVSEFLSFLDRIIACNRVLATRTIRIDTPQITKEQLFDLVNRVLEQEYLAVASDGSIKSPMKIEQLLRTTDALNTAKSLVALRNCLEHRGGIPTTDLELIFRRMRLFTGGKEILAFPHHVADEKLTFDVRLETKIMPAGSRISLSELDIDCVSLTVRFLAREILETGDREFKEKK